MRLRNPLIFDETANRTQLEAEHFEYRMRSGCPNDPELLDTLRVLVEARLRARREFHNLRVMFLAVAALNVLVVASALLGRLL